jgi:putative transposase
MRRAVPSDATPRERLLQKGRVLDQRYPRLDLLRALRERHVKHVLDDYCLRYFNTARPHQGLGQRIPASTPRQTCGDASQVVAMPVLGGLHHDYRAAA